MTSTQLIERLWWRRLARRTRAAAPRTNRLSHFEPLEQRTVLSASIWMPGGGDFFQTPHDAYRYDTSGPGGGYTAIYDVARQRDFSGGEHFGLAPHEEYAYHDPLFAPHSHDGLTPIDGMPRELPMEGRLHAIYGPSAGEGESSTSALSASSMFVSPQLPTVSSYKVEVVIVHDDAPYAPSAAIVFAPSAAPQVTMLTPGYVSAVDNGFFALLAAAAMQRRVDPPPPYGSPAGLGNLNAMTEEAGSPTGKSLESTLKSTSASLLATLGRGNDVGSASVAHISTADDESGLSEQPLSQNPSTRSSGEETDGMTELTATDVASHKRKLALSGESRSPIQTRLEQLTDIPVIRISESFFRELLVLYDNTPATSAQSDPSASEADDGMIELLAADVGAVASRHGTIPTADPSQPIALDSGIALYQSLEVASLDDIAEIAAAVQTQAAPVAPAEQLVKAE